MIPFSSTPATVGRILHAYSDHWTGPRPAIVTNAWGGNHANVNVLFDGANDHAALANVRRSPRGNTFTSVPVFDALTPEQRIEVMAFEGARRVAEFGEIRIHLEWPRVAEKFSAAAPSSYDFSRAKTEALVPLKDGGIPVTMSQPVASSAPADVPVASPAAPIVEAPVEPIEEPKEVAP